MSESWPGQHLLAGLSIPSHERFHLTDAPFAEPIQNLVGGDGSTDQLIAKYGEPSLQAAKKLY